MTDAIPAEQLDAAADGAFSGKLADPADTLTKRGGKGHVVYEGTAYDRLAWTRRCAERGYTLAAGEGALLLAELIEAEHNISALAAELAIITRERDEARRDAARLDWLSDTVAIEAFGIGDFDADAGCAGMNIYEHAAIAAYERGNDDDPTASDQREGFRRMIDAARTADASTHTEATP
jgi:hypothetical protein